jgi:hypothetical protein
VYKAKKKENDNMNRDRCADMYMPMGNVPPPRGVPWDDNMSMMPLRRSDNTMGLRMRDNTNMDCQTHEMVIEDVELAHAYVPFQKWCPTFMPLTGLKKGTIFPALVGVYGWERRQGMGADNI